MATHSLALLRPLDGADPFLGRHGFTRVPVLVQWMATVRCSLSCAHCLSASHDAGFADMPLPRALDLVDQAADLGVEELLITGGEPLLRHDLPEVIERIGRRRLRWSINTAVAPTAAQRRAMEGFPPAHAAVSIDGPSDVHDAFRGRRGCFDGALEAVGFFRGLSGCSVTAGTTVTTGNLRHLRETLSVVARLGVHRWGLHLLLPEGRAARRKDLFLSRPQLRSLLGFAARARSVFPTSLCDELGYLGEREPLVRDVPWACGAGVAQCVVLPDGSVVPCTTLDRSTRAGSLSERSLAELWAGGFAEVRRAHPGGDCAACAYVAACSAGCWLQRRAGTHCFKDTWQAPDGLRTAAGVALCLGLAACHPPEHGVEEPDTTRAGSVVGAGTIAAPPAPASVVSPQDAYPPLDAAILEHATVHLRTRGGRPPALAPVFTPALPGALADDPAGKLFLAWAGGSVAGDLPGRCAAVRAALPTSQRSLAFAALAYRVVAEPLLSADAAKRPPEQRVLLRETLDALRASVEAWRRDVFERRLDPYLARDRVSLRHRFEMSKAYRPAPPWFALGRDTDGERWGTPEQAAERAWALDGFLDRHAYAEGLRLSVSLPSAGLRLDPGGRPLGGATAVGLFDRVVTPASGGSLSMAWGSAAPLAVTLPANAELSYPDLLALLDRQHRAELDAAAAKTCEPARGEHPCDTDPRMVLAVDRLARSGNQAAAWWVADLWLF